MAEDELASAFDDAVKHVESIALDATNHAESIASKDRSSSKDNPKEQNSPTRSAEDIQNDTSSSEEISISESLEVKDEFDRLVLTQHGEKATIDDVDVEVDSNIKIQSHAGVVNSVESSLNRNQRRKTIAVDDDTDVKQVTQNTKQKKTLDSQQIEKAEPSQSTAEPDQGSHSKNGVSMESDFPHFKVIEGETEQETGTPNSEEEKDVDVELIVVADEEMTPPDSESTLASTLAPTTPPITDTSKVSTESTETPTHEKKLDEPSSSRNKPTTSTKTSRHSVKRKSGSNKIKKENSVSLGVVVTGFVLLTAGLIGLTVYLGGIQSQVETLSATLVAANRPAKTVISQKEINKETTEIHNRIDNLAAKVSTLNTAVINLNGTNPKLSDAPQNQRIQYTAKPQKPVANLTKQNWVVKLLSVRQKSIADDLQTKFRSKGVPIEQQSVEIDGKTIYRLGVSGFNSRHQANEYAENAIKKLGLNSYWVSQ